MARRPSGELRIVLDLIAADPSQELSRGAQRPLRVSLGHRLGRCGQGVETPVKAEHAPPDARDLIIAIDAGHGGEDPGAIGKNGTREKDVVLAIARQLARSVSMPSRE